nr:15011_t:CDS:2 [Entrophospora candida]
MSGVCEEGDVSVCGVCGDIDDDDRGCKLSGRTGACVSELSSFESTYEIL